MKFDKSLDWKNTMSKSSINTYLICPLKWKYHYLDKLDEKMSIEADIGIKVHNALDKFYDKIDYDNEISVEYFFNILKEIEPDKNCLLFLENFAKFEYNRYHSCINRGYDIKEYFIPTYREKQCASTELGLNGIIDRVDRLDENTYCVIDIKTGVFKQSKIHFMRRELCIYALLANAHPDIKENVTWVGGYFPRSNDVFFEKLGTRTINATLRAVAKVKQDIKDKKFHAQPSRLCGWCSFTRICHDEKKYMWIKDQLKH